MLAPRCRPVCVTFVYAVLCIHTSALLNSMIEATFVYATDLLARSVNKSWKRVVKEANLEPLEAGASKAEQEQGRECQQHLEEALRKEAELWTPQYQDQLSQHLSKESEVCIFVIALDLETVLISAFASLACT